MPIVLLDISGCMTCKMIGDDTKATCTVYVRKLVRRLHADTCARGKVDLYTQQTLCRGRVRAVNRMLCNC